MQHDVAVACSALDLVVVPAQLLFYKALPLMGQSRIGCQTAVTPIFFLERCYPSNGCLSIIVSSRSGPVEMMSMGTPQISSIFFR